MHTDNNQFIPLEFAQLSHPVMTQKSAQFFKEMNSRRTVRTFSSKPIPIEVIQNCIKTASSAPSGAHKQPWTFCVIENRSLKSKIRAAAEKEEYENYHGRMSDEWIEDLKPFNTNWHKPFLDIAPYLIVVFKKAYDMVDGKKLKNYYVNESVGLAAGFLLAALHQAGLATLTHTPSPMNFLCDLLERPNNERPFLLIPTGYPEEGTVVPDLTRKSIDDVMIRYQ